MLLPCLLIVYSLAHTLKVSGPGTKDSDADKELVKSREFIEVATQIWLEAMQRWRL